MTSPHDSVSLSFWILDSYKQATMVSLSILVLSLTTASAFVHQSGSPSSSFMRLQKSRGALLRLRRDPSFLHSGQNLELVLLAVGAANEDNWVDTTAADSDYTAVPDSRQLHTALAERVAALQNGIGKRYVCRTQRGFLNVHREPGDPYDTTNIVNQLVDGQVVTSTSAAKDGWLQHDAGGWSVILYGGFVWLEPLSE
jgi:hypothetical protein